MTTGKRTTKTKRKAKKLKSTVGTQERSPLDEPPCIALIGASGRGKTTEAFRAFPQARWYTTGPTVLGRPADMADSDPNFPQIDKKRISPLEDGLNPLSKKTRKQLELQPWDEWMMEMHENMAEVARKRRDKGLSRPFYVLDDGGIFFRWWWRDLLARVPAGRGWGHPSPYDEAKQLIDALVYTAKRGPFGFLWTFHKANAVYWPDDHADPDKAGTLKYRAGMQLPYGGLIETIGASLDMVAELELDEDGDLALNTTEDEETFRKIRRELKEGGESYKLTEGRTLRTFLEEHKFNLEG